MKNYQDEQERKIRKEFVLFLKTYGVHKARVVAENLVFQCECYLRAMAKTEGK